jgi:phenylacetic acid degradation operon negative regulatory protein
VEPLTARSLVLTALLGTHPPQLPVRALVALGELFGFAEGTMRTALSRMAATGEVETGEGRYALGDRLRRRQESQDAGRHPPPAPWDGTWWVAIVDAEGRSVAERREFRSRMRQHRMGELRPDIWLRPANIAGPPSNGDLLVSRGPIEQREPAALVARLWDLDDLAQTARALTSAAHEAARSLGGGDPGVLPDTFMTSVAVVRFFQREPLLPPELVGPRWPVDGLRTAYEQLEREHMAMLASFLSRAAAEARPSGGG